LRCSINLALRCASTTPALTIGLTGSTSAAARRTTGHIDARQDGQGDNRGEFHAFSSPEQHPARLIASRS
jgi:hypothetical protein